VPFGLIAAGLALSVPLLVPFHTYPFTTFYSEWTAFLLGLVAAAFALLGRKEPPRLPWLGLALIGFCAVVLIQIPLGMVTYPEKSFVGICYALWAAVLVWAGAALRERYSLERTCLWLQVALAAGGWLVAMGGFMQFFEIHAFFGQFVEQVKGAGMYGAVAQRNLFANYVACGLVSTCFLFGRRRIGIALVALLAIPMAIAMAYSGSRGAWVYVVVLAIVAGWASIKRREQAGGWRLLAASCMTISIFALFRLGPAAEVIDRGADTAWYLGAGGGLAPRLFLAVHSWLMFEAHPLLGVGYGEFAWNLFQNAVHFEGRPTPGIDRNAHNVALQLLAETGLAGFLVVAAGAIAWARDVWRRGVSIEVLWIVTVLAIQAAHSMVEFPLWYSSFLGITSLLAGVVAERGVPFGVSRLGKYLKPAIVMVGFVVLGVVWRDYRNFESWFDETQRMQRAHQPLRPEQFQSLVELHRTSLFAPYFEMMITEVMTVDPDLLQQKLQLNAEAMHMFPLPSAACRQAILLAISGDGAAGWEQWRRLRVVYPFFEATFREQLQALAKRVPQPGVARLNTRVQAAPPTIASPSVPISPRSRNEICWKGLE
jgi:O-antigen ligase